jgi:hypothetical protein
MLLGLLLVLASVSGCSDETDSYCAELRDQKQALADLAAQAGRPGSDVLGDTLEIWRDLRDTAPGDIRDEWSTLVFALEGLVDAFHAAGTTPGEYDPGSPPEGVSEAESKRLQEAAGELASPRVRTAGESVEQHARDVCKVDLGLGAQGG